MQITFEEPCEATKQSCEWVVEEWGEFLEHWDMYCLHCYRQRDWNKAEYESKEEKP